MFWDDREKEADEVTEALAREADLRETADHKPKRTRPVAESPLFLLLLLLYIVAEEVSSVYPTGK